MQLDGNLQALLEDNSFAPLPPIHQDPFDRMLVAQDQAEGLELMTADTVIPRDRVRVISARE